MKRVTEERFLIICKKVLVKKVEMKIRRTLELPPYSKRGIEGQAEWLGLEIEELEKFYKILLVKAGQEIFLT